jgi:hypothetical protein
MLLLSWRFLLAILVFYLTSVQYMQRINMSVAIVCMINNTALKEIKMNQLANSSEFAETQLLNETQSDSTAHNALKVEK